MGYGHGVTGHEQRGEEIDIAIHGISRSKLAVVSLLRFPPTKRAEEFRAVSFVSSSFPNSFDFDLNGQLRSVLPAPGILCNYSRALALPCAVEAGTDGDDPRR
ncbi:hypothetical protein IEQ34_017145 [Dendrobium chrysotoxum]|uniref:Uncharacterized protein n=1 Tax=Dendrobium chrysotoxum TaxID=161865 RepID=A0AAV7G8R4_DENCH|nr:hypothetical protein IEQ34_017145 [Dendrobium chrysotoxum]